MILIFTRAVEGRKSRQTGNTGSQSKKPRAFMGWSTTKGNSIASDAFVRFTLSFWTEWLAPPYDTPLYQAIAKALASNPSVQGKAIPIVYGSNQLTWKE